jgi:ABC-type lipoprotein export system ATPase subunit
MSIHISNLVKSYPNSSAPVINIASFSLERGEKIALLGRSGSGKSTLLNSIAGIITPTSGSVKINDVEITSLSEAKRDRFRAETIGYVFQTFNLLQGLTALENVVLAMGFAKKHKNATARAKELLVQVGLQNELGKKPRELSVGQQQRVAIARAVANDPAVILADEPTANLDEESSALVLKLLTDIASEQNRILILVTHEREVASALPKSVELNALNVGRG